MFWRKNKLLFEIYEYIKMNNADNTMSLGTLRCFKTHLELLGKCEYSLGTQYRVKS